MAMVPTDVARCIFHFLGHRTCVVGESWWNDGVVVQSVVSPM